MAVSVRKWGNSSGILFPSPAIAQAGFSEGDKLHLYVIDEGAFYLGEKAHDESLNYQVLVTKWGNGLGFRVPKHVLSDLNADLGTQFKISVKDKGLVFEKLTPKTIVFAKDVPLADGTVIKAGTEAGKYIKTV